MCPLARRERVCSDLAPHRGQAVQPGGIQQRLNMATRHWHADVDAPWLELLRPTVRRADYIAQLVRAYGFLAPFESASRYTPGIGRTLDFQQLTRAGLIAHDLLALGLSPAQVATIPQCHSIVTFKDVPDALGWMYLVERSTLLHDGIRRRLVATIPHVEGACTYLDAYHGNAADHWHAFGRVLERAGAKPETANAIVAAATDAFACAKRWFTNARETTRSTA